MEKDNKLFWGAMIFFGLLALAGVFLARSVAASGYFPIQNFIPETTSTVSVQMAQGLNVEWDGAQWNLTGEIAGTWNDLSLYVLSAANSNNVIAALYRSTSTNGYCSGVDTSMGSVTLSITAPVGMTQWLTATNIGISLNGYPTSTCFFLMPRYMNGIDTATGTWHMSDGYSYGNAQINTSSADLLFSINPEIFVSDDLVGQLEINLLYPAGNGGERTGNAATFTAEYAVSEEYTGGANGIKFYAISETNNFWWEKSDWDIATLLATGTESWSAILPNDTYTIKACIENFLNGCLASSTRTGFLISGTAGVGEHTQTGVDWNNTNLVSQVQASSGLEYAEEGFLGTLFSKLGNGIRSVFPLSWIYGIKDIIDAAEATTTDVIIAIDWPAGGFAANRQWVIFSSTTAATMLGGYDYKTMFDRIIWGSLGIFMLLASIKEIKKAFNPNASNK